MLYKRKFVGVMGGMMKSCFAFARMMISPMMTSSIAAKVMYDGPLSNRGMLSKIAFQMLDAAKTKIPSEIQNMPMGTDRAAVMRTM